MRFMADDCAFETTAGSEVCGQRYERREALRKASARVFSIFPDTHFGDPRHFLAGDRGRTEWTFTGAGPTVSGSRSEPRPPHLRGRQDRPQVLVL